MNYDMQQPGGLTDAQFDENPRQSVRSRNWFGTPWNVFSLNFDTK
jgi:Fe(3+) dicitrate transport protein